MVSGERKVEAQAPCGASSKVRLNKKEGDKGEILTMMNHSTQAECLEEEGEPSKEKTRRL